MAETKRFKVVAKKDHISKIAAGSPESALAELIWNSLDADANNVDVFFSEGPLGINKILVRDDGGGIEYEKARGLFTSLGGSWKTHQRKTEKERFLHGKDGKGRFKSFVLGMIVRWDVVYRKDNRYMRYLIEERSDSIDEFTLSDESEIDTINAGVEVQITELNKQFQILKKEDAIEKLTPIFAPYLSNYPDIQLRIEGTQIDPAKVIHRKSTYKLDPFVVNDSKYHVELEIVEWNSIKERELWFCNENGFPLDIYNKQIRGIGDFGYSGYLKSSYLQQLHDRGDLALGDLNKELHLVCDQAVKKIKEHFLERTIENSRDQLNKWKDEDVYPYKTEPQTPVEKAERQVFDIIALNLNQNLPDFELTEKKMKSFQLRMLRQAVEKSPEELQLIISEVLHLPKNKQDQLAELVKEASLSAIISASRLVADRLKKLSGLEQILFDENIKKHVKERSQLHRILADNTWIFGHEYTLSVDDRGLTEVLRKHVEKTNGDIVVDKPVRRIDESVGIVDLMLSRSIPRNHSNELEHLVVELKAPRIKIGQNEIRQTKDYAFAVARDERFRRLDTRWHFWVISNDIDEYGEMELNQEGRREGVIYKSNKKDIDITIWIKTWAQLIEENKHRLEFIRDKLNYNIDREDALIYLKKTYAEYTQGLDDQKQK